MKYLDDKPKQALTPEQQAEQRQISELKQQLAELDKRDRYIRIEEPPDNVRLLEMLLEQAQNRHDGHPGKQVSSLPLIKVINPNANKQTSEQHRFLVQRPPYEPLQGYFIQDDDDDDNA